MKINRYLIKKLLLLSFGLLCVAMFSCDENTDGKSKDSIKLSTSHLDFVSGGGTETVTSKHDSWIIIEIRENQESIDFRANINPEGKVFEYIGEWYSIKREYTNIIVSVKENTSMKPRQLYIRLQNANWFGSTITINQAQ